MSVTEGNIQVQETGEYLDTTKVTQTDDTVVHREAVVIADPEDIDARANVLAADGMYGENVFSHELIRVSGLLRELIEQQKLTNTYLRDMF